LYRFFDFINYYYLLICSTEFEQLSEHIFDKIRNFIRRALDDCRKKPADVDEIEIIGGSSRIPMIRKIISDIFGKDAKTTMNQDEAVARGML
jgi:molecular chaperone DnaK (HSP70)